MNAELNTVAAAGCPEIQIEEPMHHFRAQNPKTTPEDMAFLTDAFNREVDGVEAEIWVHTCWGNPSQQRIFKEVQSYRPALEHLNRLDADVLTFETCSSGTADLPAIGEIITNKKIAIGVVDHHTLQVERPDEVADLIREALKYIPVERLVISTDCGMGREGMSRRHAVYKIIALVQGTNIVRKELGLPEARVRAEDPDYSLTIQAV